MGEGSLSKKNLKKHVELKDKDRKKLKAIAVKYDLEKDRAPKIIASGKGGVAEEILRLAEENGVPLYEDASLADLLARLELDTEVPPELYTLVAEVLSFVYQLDRMAKKRSLLRKKYKK